MTTSKDDELMLITSFDQSIDSDDLSVLERIDDVIKEAIEQKNAYIALSACKSLLMIAKTSGLGLAKILYLISYNWSSFEIEDEFNDVVFEHLGMHKYTVSRYVRVWEMHQEDKIPKKYEQRILQRNIRDQIPIATAIKQGCEITDKQWEKLANAADFQEVSQIVREDIKGKERKKGLLQIFIDDMGTIYATKEGKRRFVGTLQIKDNDEIVQQAIQRIISNTGIRESS